jgi:hypothetical protein
MHGASSRERVLAGRDTGQRAQNETESDLLLDKRDEQDEVNERGAGTSSCGDHTRALRVRPSRCAAIVASYPQDEESIEENWHEEPNERADSCAGWEKVQALLADGEHSE